MGVRREDLVEGGRVFMKTRLAVFGGAATAQKLKPARIKKVLRAAVELELIDEKNRSITVPFNQLEADTGFLDEQERRREQNKKRQAELKLVEEAPVQAPPALTYTLADKLKREALQPVKAPEQTPPGQSDLLKSLEAIPDPIGETDDWAQKLVTAWPKEDQSEAAQARHIEPPLTKKEKGEQYEFPGMRPAREYERDDGGTIPAPGTPRKPEPVQPEPDDDDEDELDEPPVIAPRPEPAPAPPDPSAPKPTPIQVMLQKVQSELEALIAQEADIEPRLSRLQDEIVELTAELKSNRQQQKVLAAKERNVLAMAKRLGGA